MEGLRLGRGRVSDVLRRLDERVMNALAEAVAEDLSEVIRAKGLVWLAQRMLDKCGVERVAELIAEAEVETGDTES